MRVFARIVLGIAFFVLLGVTFKTQVLAQTTTTGSYFNPNADANVPVNHHAYSQIVLIDTVSAIMCQLTGIDPTDPNQPCLGINPATGKIAIDTTPNGQAVGQAQNSQVGGILGLMASSIGILYTPAVSSSQYVGYLADNFGIVKKTYAASALPNCTANQFGYGFCGLGPIFSIWASMRDFAYAILTILFIAIGVGVMLRFKVDPRTVMTLQNQIPRVIIAILLITFSYAIAGILIDLMWTVTYTGINFITAAAPANSTIDLCDNRGPQPIANQADTRLLDQPISFTNTVFRSTCGNGFRDSNSGLLKLADKVSSSLGDLVSTTVHDLLFPDGNKSCHASWWNLAAKAKCAVTGAVLNFILWFAEQIVKIIVIIAILQALLGYGFN